MLNKIFFVCLGLGLFTATAALSCQWMDHKFRQYSTTSLDLLNMMASTNSTNTTEVVAERNETVAFPEHLYRQISEASAEAQLAFSVQVLKEIADLFNANYTAASWEERQVDSFLNIVYQQADGLHSCIVSHGLKKKSKKLQMYFKRLSHSVLREMEYSAEAWEMIRMEIRHHLMRSDLLVASLLAN